MRGQGHREGALDGRHGAADRRPRQRRQDVRGGRFPLHRAHHQPGPVPGHQRGRASGARKDSAARGRQTRRHRPDHAADPEPPPARRHDRQILTFLPFFLRKKERKQRKTGFASRGR